MSSDRIITDQLVASLLQSVAEFRADIEKALKSIADTKRKMFAAERLLDMAEAEGANVGDLSELRRFNAALGKWKIPKIADRGVVARKPGLRDITNLANTGPA